MIRVFCNACSKFLRVARQEDIKGLQEHELCGDCKEAIDSAWREIETITAQQVKRINIVYNKARAGIEASLQKVVNVREGD